MSVFQLANHFADFCACHGFELCAAVGVTVGECVISDGGVRGAELDGVCDLLGGCGLSGGLCGRGRFNNFDNFDGRRRDFAEKIQVAHHVLARGPLLALAVNDQHLVSDDDAFAGLGQFPASAGAFRALDAVLFTVGLQGVRDNLVFFGDAKFAGFVIHGVVSGCFGDPFAVLMV